MKKSLNAKGFTLIELMIVVAILAVLASIAIPKFTLMVEKSREGATKGNLGTLRAAISLYYGSNGGIWPTTLQTGESSYLSGYLSELPNVTVTGVFIGSNAISPAGCIVTYTVQNSVPNASSSGWLYDSTAGRIFVNSTIHDSQGVAFSYYGFE